MEVYEYLREINDQMFLPGRQREFVWERDSIEMLFDSLIRNYPVGSVTLWNVRRDSPGEEYFAYDILREYIDEKRAIPPSVRNKTRWSRTNDRTDDRAAETAQWLVIDGQQRLTSLYIGALGSIVTFEGGKGRSKEKHKNWAEKRLCVNLFGHPDWGSGSFNGDYEFQFRSVGGIEGDSIDNQTGYSVHDGVERYWLPLNDMFTDSGDLKDDRTLRDLASECVDDMERRGTRAERDDLKDAARTVIGRVKTEVFETELCREDVKQADPSEISEQFERLNAQGKSPRPYQILLTKLMDKWPYSEPKVVPRERLEDFTDSLKRAFPAYAQEIDYEFVLRFSCALLGTKLNKGNVRALKDEDIAELKRIWLGDGAVDFEQFNDAIHDAFATITDIGFSRRTMNALSMAIVLAVFYYKNPAAKVDATNRNAAFNFLATARLLQASGSDVTTRSRAFDVTQHLRDISGDLEVFPGEELLNEFGYTPTVDGVETLVDEARYEPGKDTTGKFGTKEAAAVLGLLRETYAADDSANFQIDHIYPKSRVDEVEAANGCEVDIHRLGNLQLLPERENRPGAKGTAMPSEWLDNLGPAEEDRYRRVNLYPDAIEATPSNYNAFVEARERRIVEYICHTYVTRYQSERVSTDTTDNAASNIQAD